jgi:hypothetical protein
MAPTSAFGSVVRNASRRRHPRAAARGARLGADGDERRGATLSIEESIPNVVKSVEAQAGKAGLRFIDRHGKTVPW